MKATVEQFRGVVRFLEEIRDAVVAQGRVGHDAVEVVNACLFCKFGKILWQASFWVDVMVVRCFAEVGRVSNRKASEFPEPAVKANL